MKKLLLILCFLPMFSFGSTPYKILADTVFIGSIPYRTATGELLLFNNTKDTTESVLYNTGNGKTEFKKVRLIRLNDSTYVFKIGTTVIGDSIKIRSSGSGGGGGGSGTVTDFIFTDGNGFDGTVTNSTTTPTLVLVADTLTKFASVKRVLDSITALRNIRKVDSIYKKSTNRDLTYFKINGTEYSFIDSVGGSGTVTSVATDNTLTGGTITTTGTLKVDTSIISTKGNVTGLLLAKQNTLTLGTGVTTYLAQTRSFQTLTDGATITYNISSGYNATVTLGGNRTLSITNVAAGDYGTLVVTQDGAGSRTLTLPASSKVINGGSGAIVLTTTASATDVLSWFYDGTNYYWTYGKNYN